MPQLSRPYGMGYTGVSGSVSVVELGMPIAGHWDCLGMVLLSNKARTVPGVFWQGLLRCSIVVLTQEAAPQTVLVWSIPNACCCLCPYTLLRAAVTLCVLMSKTRHVLI